MQKNVGNIYATNQATISKQVVNKRQTGEQTHKSQNLSAQPTQEPSNEEETSKDGIGETNRGQMSKCRKGIDTKPETERQPPKPSKLKKQKKDKARRETKAGRGEHNQPMGITGITCRSIQSPPLSQDSSSEMIWMFLFSYAWCAHAFVDAPRHGFQCALQWISNMAWTLRM